jgi:hypothetical protein
MFNIDLGPTSTFKSRMATWLAGGSSSCDGFLVVKAIPLNGKKVQSDTYGICQLPRTRYEWKVKVWKLPPITDDDLWGEYKQKESQVDPGYVVTIKGNFYRCSCKGNCHGDGTCKHAQAVKALIANGILKQEAVAQ